MTKATLARAWIIGIGLLSLSLLNHSLVNGEDPERASRLEYASTIRPLLERYCYECHAKDVAEAELDLSAFETQESVRQQTGVWMKVRRMLDTRQMPPMEAPQPKDGEQTKLRHWVRSFLAREAMSRAGDPGPVVLRRLSNSEYTYSIRELTNVESLNPAHEFPVDGAAGEGFTNVGDGQGMSPAMLRKYLDAAKGVAEHIVFLPAGIRFSPHTTSRDWTDERLGAIRRFYEQHTVKSNVFVNVGGAGRVANEGGAIPLEQYLAATLEERGALERGEKTIARVAHERSLSAKYLNTLWTALSRDVSAQGAPAPMMDALRKKWRLAAVEDSGKLVAEIEAGQKELWKFNPIGHLGREGGPKSWMEAVATPVVEKQELRLKLSDIAVQESAHSADTAFYLSVGDFGDGNSHDFVVLEQPRLELQDDRSGNPRRQILLRDIRAQTALENGTIASQADQTVRYLNAVSQMRRSSKSVEQIAKAQRLDPEILTKWRILLRLEHSIERKVTGHLTTKLNRVADKAALNGWGSSQTPSVLANSSNQDIAIGTPVIPARGVTMHPSPTMESVVAWRSPMEGRIKVQGLLADADDKCGNGAAWRLERASATGSEILASGVIDNGQDQRFTLHEELTIASGDVLSLVVNARDKSHICDTTQIAWKLSEIGGGKRVWDLAADVVEKITQGNPLPDSHGNKDIWHFCARKDGARGRVSSQLPVIPPDSSLAKWRTAVVASRPADKIAKRVQDILTSKNESEMTAPDKRLRTQILKGCDPALFGKHPLTGQPLPEADLCLQAPTVLQIRMPAKLAAGAEFVATAVMHAKTGQGGAVQVQAQTSKPVSASVSPRQPVLISRGGDTRRRLKEFQNLFPPAVCYARIVPVDEVVTLTLFHREDEHLKRLILNEEQSAEIDRLWEELIFVSQEPLQLAVVYEQLLEFASQDRPDLVKAFAPMRQSIDARAKAFGQRLQAAEPTHLSAVLKLADRAWRRPLTESEKRNLRDLYQGLRNNEISHQEAIRLTLARVLTSPSFLYKLEHPVAGKEAAKVTDLELASRLSYFLWSSLPDEQLRECVESGKLASDDALVAQMRRMLKDPRARRLAVEFACQWLHVRGFDRNDDKNERLYPEFAAIRGLMHKEIVQFFTLMFQTDGSILDILGADHTFLNERLAKHYGIAGVEGESWQRVDRIRSKGRGGVLGMAAFLSSQSGASRTSPILRGNWIYETLLGERLPRPPANVPQLPDLIPQGLTARELIERHVSDAACAKCHARIDPYGFSLEQYDALGRLRSNKVDTRTRLFDGKQIDGLDGLRNHLLQDRRADFTRQFCRKLLGFALGRELQLSDEPLLDEMQEKLAENDFRFSVAVETIITSRQFREIRGDSFVAD